MNLRSNWDGTTQEYNDIWGYTDPAGSEYAIIGSSGQTHFINISDPDNPVQVASIAGRTSSSWRDFKTYKSYAYGVSEGSGSLQIFDLSKLPNEVEKVYDSNQFFTNCHNIFIDTKHGRLYAVGTSIADVVLLDLSNTPAAPTLIKNIDLRGNYVHDIYVRDHIGYCSHEFRGLYVYDFTDPNEVLEKGTLTSYVDKGYNHSSWLSNDGKTLTMADETHGLAVKVIDVSDLMDIEVVSTFKSTLVQGETNSIAHNPFIIGDQYVAVSYYHDGVQVYDISDPAKPTKVAYYDTYPTNTDYTGGEGAWGVYPYLPSGNVIASDISSGLFVLTPDLECAFNQKIEGAIGAGDYSAAQNIMANGAIATAGAVTFSAGVQIDLLPGFEAFKGSDFIAAITGCQGVTPTTITAPSPPPSSENNYTITADHTSFKTLAGIAAYPNPTADILSIHIEEARYLPCQLQIVAMDGSVLQEINLSEQAPSHQLALEQYGKGMYMLHFRTPERMISQKVFVLGR